MARFASIGVVLLLCVGCKKGEDKAAPAPAPASPADCDRLGARTSEQSMEHTPPGVSPEARQKLKEVSDEAGAMIASLCKSDGWTADAVACGLAAKDPGRECHSKLTAAQREKMEHEVQAIFSRGMSGGGGH